MRRFFWAPKTYVKTDGQENIYNFTLKIFVYLNLWSSLLFQGLEVIESTNLKYFTKEMTAEFYALKGMFLAQIGRSDDANKAFSAAVQMHDTLVKAWALWGDYLEQVFTRDK